MSVIVSRALPDVRDRLKPVHRRLLFAMDELGLRSERGNKKRGAPHYQGCEWGNITPSGMSLL